MATDLKRGDLVTVTHKPKNKQHYDATWLDVKNEFINDLCVVTSIPDNEAGGPYNIWLRRLSHGTSWRFPIRVVKKL